MDHYLTLIRYINDLRQQIRLNNLHSYEYEYHKNSTPSLPPYSLSLHHLNHILKSRLFLQISK
eukprot:UN17784